jgi:hypothetical protein
MEFMLAEKLAQLDKSELLKLLMAIRMEDRDAFNLIKEKLEDL